MNKINSNPQIFLILKMIKEKDYSPVLDNLVTEDMFFEYEDHFLYLREFYDTYNKLPSLTSFLNKFEEVVNVDTEDDFDVYIDEIINRYKLFNLKQVIESSVDKISEGSIRYDELYTHIINKLQDTNFNRDIHTVNIMDDVSYRTKDTGTYLPTGVDSLDDYILGLRRGEELLTVFARTNVGKTWFILKILTFLCKEKYRVGLVSPEMSYQLVSYRADTLMEGFDNKDLMKGDFTKPYLDYIDNLKNEGYLFNVYSLKDFNNKVTISKLRNIVKSHKLDLLAIDGISYIMNERGSRYQSMTEKLMDISMDLINLSVELKIPIIVSVQANRIDSKTGGKTLNLESIRDSDSIAHNSTRVISLGYDWEARKLYLGIKKNRYGKVGSELEYKVDWNLGKFEFVQDVSDYNKVSKEDRQVDKVVENSTSRRKLAQKEIQKIIDNSSTPEIEDEEDLF